MTENDPSEEPRRLRSARIIHPPHPIKQKVGSGGLDASIIFKAENVIRNNEIDFRPIGEQLLKDLDKAIDDTKKSPAKGEAFIEAMLYPALQFQVQGAMFHFPLASEIGTILVNFLETAHAPVSKDAIEVVDAHRMTLSMILESNMAYGDHPQGHALKQSLTDACARYHKTRKH